MSFIGVFEVPTDIITPTELEEQRLIQEEKAAKEKRSQELYDVRYKQRKADKREFTARKKAGLLTPEEIEEDERRRDKRKTAEAAFPK